MRRAGDPSGFEYVHLSVNKLDIGGESFGGDVDGLSFPTVPIDSSRGSLVNLVHGQNDVRRLGELVLELDALRVLPSVDFGSSSLLLTRKEHDQRQGHNEGSLFSVSDSAS